jgi:outer membrane protein assembly factor BamB
MKDMWKAIVGSAVLLFLVITLPVFLSRISAQTLAKDWPQYRGPNRDGVSTETGLIKSFPANGPQKLWTSPIGESYSAIAISNGKLFTMDSDGKDEFVVCLDAATGKQLWRTHSDSMFSNDQGNGPRSTPTIDGNMIYALGAKGQLLALSAVDGKKIWGHDLVKEFGSEIPNWGTSTTPLVEKDLLIVDVGGNAGHSIMAFHKKNGSVAWKVHTDKQGYSCPIAVTVNGVRQILVFTGTTLVSVSPEGKLLWKYPWRTSWDANIATPIFIPPDKVFISTSYDVGAAVLQIKAANGAASVQEIWKSRVMKNHFNSSVLHNGHIYGFDDATLKCINALTGEEKWKERGFAKGSLLLADGKLIILGERGKLALAEAKPDAYTQLAEAQVLDGKCWTMPAIANGKLYVRNQKNIIAFDLKAPS